MFGKLWQKIRNFFISGWLAFSKFLCCVLEAFGSSPLSRCYAAARAYLFFPFSFSPDQSQWNKNPAVYGFSGCTQRDLILTH